MRGLALGRRFDGILAWDSFFHLNYDDQRRMFAVFADHASAGAWLMFNTGHRTAARRSHRRIPRRSAASRKLVARRV